MFQRPPFDDDRSFTAWLERDAQLRPPDALLEQVLGRTAATRRRPGWLVIERWFPMDTTARFGAIPRTAIILATLLLLTGLASVAIAFGASPAPTPNLPPPRPLPFGPARNGLIAYDSNGDIWVMNPDGSGRKQLTAGPQIDTTPSWSPDGTRLAFWSWPAPADASGLTIGAQSAKVSTTPTASLVVTDADGHGLVTLAKDLNIDNASASEGAAWSPDSRTVAYAVGSSSGATEIDVASLDTPEPNRLVATGDLPVWSPDGATIAYRIDGIGVRRVASDGTQTRTISHGSGSGVSFLQPQWSPDGKKVAFAQASASRPDIDDIWVVNADGTGEIDISSSTTEKFMPAWSPDGMHIAFCVVQDANVCTYGVMASDGTDLEGLDQPKWSGFTAWSPDGTRLLGIESDATGASTFLTMTDPLSSTVDRAPIVDSLGNPSWQRLAP